ncbi:MAG TPA: polysaccharide pyruvyl transferase family protein [Acidimicrobiales bacterium]|nr:polysaccharide pyruvyl transferase family protein [Acidimicrobiales bacterium]
MDPTPPVIGMWGTFDVDNYGDHLFPLVAARELGRRLPGVELRFASPYGRLHPTRFDGAVHVGALPPWSTAAAGALLADHDCVLVGGGEIVHGNDRMLAPVYGASADELNALRPSGWFLETSTLSRSTLVVWHGVGVGDVRDPRVARGAGAADLVAVRDQPSRDRLLGAGVAAERVSVVPDTAFLIDRVFTRGDLAAAEGRLRRAGVLGERRRIVVQGCDLLEAHAGELALVLRALTAERGDLEIVVAETGLGRGDALFADRLIGALDADVPLRRMPREVGLVDIAATIGASDVFLGSSLHGCITAAVFDRPFVCLDFAGEPKLAGLVTVAGGCGHAATDAAGADRALRRALGAPAHPRGVVAELQRRVDVHFDRIADVARAAAGACRAPRPARAKPASARHPAAARSSGAVVGLVVVNHDGGATTLACLDRLARLTWPASRRRIVLVDNGSSDGVLDEVARRWPEVDVVASPTNVGFGRACNAALARLGPVDHVALVNNDAFVEPGFVEPLVGRLQEDVTLGAVVPTVLFADRFVVVDVSSDAGAPGAWDGRRLGVRLLAAEADGVDVTARCRIPAGGWGAEVTAEGSFEWMDGNARLLVPAQGDLPEVKLLLDAGQHRRRATLRCGTSATRVVVDGPTWVAVPPGEPVDVVNGRGIVFGPDGSASDLGCDEVHRPTATTLAPVEIAAWSGAAVVLRRAYLDDVGPFRDDLFLYYEDVDLSLRGSRRGWRYENVPWSVVRHVHGAAASRSPQLARHVSARNRLLVLTEHAPAAVVAAAVLAHARAVVDTIRHDVVGARRSGRPASTAYLRRLLLVFGGYVERLPRSLRGRWRDRRLPPPRWAVDDT